ncbi:glycosyltransferase [Paraburkholderia sp. J94]|uniref:glycosyltransferase n=1 Tax=Paraburkholderia sp. J94 TaxID=2805441 RepID=UPI002AB0E1AE|nr:glycosyltransferase [Paraburkholderia sp. J94]
MTTSNPGESSTQYGALSSAADQVGCLSAASFWTPDYFAGSAWHEHAPFAFWLTAAIGPRVFVELGEHPGFSYLVFCQAVQRLQLSARCYAIDTWRGEAQAGLTNEAVLEALLRSHVARYEVFSRLIRARSDEARDGFEDGTIDLLHIDGHRGYEDVRAEYANWLPKLSSRAVVLFHNTLIQRDDSGVGRLWRELSERHAAFGFEHGQGLGVLCPTNVPAPLQALFDADEPARAAIRAAYARLGAAVAAQFAFEKAEAALLEHHGDALPHGPESDRIAELEQALSEARADFEGARKRLASARADHSMTQASLARMRNELGALQGSVMWRAFSVARKVASRVPPSTRANLRRAARMLWWAATPHRIPARLQFLRMRAAQRTVSGPVIALGNRSYFEFLPTPGEGQSDAVPEGVYQIGQSSGGYVYVPKRRPDDIERRIAAMTRRPTFSIVVPLYNTDDYLFRRMAGSVLAQWYPHWELILVDDKSPDASVRERAARLDDPRVRLIALDQNQGISGATNRGLEQAQGDYIVFLDHDDELTDDCLYELAQSIEAEDPDYVYSDEDKIMPDGRFAQPFYKPDWSPDTLMSTMFTCHVSCVRRSLLDRVGHLRSEFDGAQDWDFVLRVTEQTRRIAHVPKVLYHWRVIPQSVASDLNAKPYAIDAARRARLDALERRGLIGEVEAVPTLPGYFRVKYDVQGTPLVSIIIPSKNNGDVLKRCVDSILARTSYPAFEVVVMDNGSSERSTLACLDALRAIRNVRVIPHDFPFNYSEINNVGARESKGEILLFLNDDTEVISGDWIERLAGYAQLDHVGAVGAKLLYPGTRQIQHCGILNLADGPGHAMLRGDADTPGYFDRNLLEYDWMAVTGACLMVERGKFEAAGGFDESLPIAYNDVDLCFRLIELGYFNVVSPAVELYHYESLSRGQDGESEAKRRRLVQERQRLYRKHPRFLMNDPFHNPNLAPNDVYFSLP